jgi:hypothetical protein
MMINPKCQHKIAFRSAREARAAAMQAEHFHGTKLKVYRCRYCGLWHLASH